MKKISFGSSKLKNFLKGKSIGLALSLAAVAIGIGAIASYNKTISSLNENPRYTQNTDQTQDVGVNQTGIPKPTETTPSTSEKPVEPPVITPTQPKVMPVNGEILEPFSNGELVKNETLNVWKTHDGVDIKAQLGTQVKAITLGVVKEVWDDPLWGVCVIIDHGNGFEGHYYNLAKSLTVSAGDTVNAGTIIGSIGDTADCESLMVSHLHLGLKEDGKWIDPLSFISPKK